ncbi:chromate transporter [Peptostreptococcus equinus]|uniref:Chromate transporter n=1 Tax=Peptostreptococcus equinus TaxID=3003601 RepID=A0ABY7JR09_9FIRM|nr:chromate transporter [Peptostreptococcus sp. CBA3647]WAW15778.1 chromate transporter [Peptostreptococcus sp. CBA3647]
MNSLLVFVTFVKIGAFSFGGGYAVLPLIQKYIVEVNGWMSIDQMTDLISLSQLTPGPIAINAATFVGTKLGGLPGAIIATFGEVLPSCILMLLLGNLLFRGKKIKFMDYILSGLKPAVAGLILVAAISMFTSSILNVELKNITIIISTKEIFSSINYLGLIGFFFAIIMQKYRKNSVIKTLLLSAFLGLILYFMI